MHLPQRFPFFLVLLSLALPLLGIAQKVSPLGTKPDWSALDPYQSTITRADFIAALDAVYSSPFDYKSTLKIDDTGVDVLKESGGEEFYRINFLPEGEPVPKIERYWRPAKELPRPPSNQPLQDLHVAIDPGHIGGDFAKMEERWFSIDGETAIMEGELTLVASRLIADKLTALGARVSMVRNENKPLSKRTPNSYFNEAKQFLADRGVAQPPQGYTDAADPQRFFSIQWQSEKLFYRTGEIIERALLVNEVQRPDLVLCIHLNAEDWGDPKNPTYVDANHAHILINGSYNQGELGHDDIRFFMLQRLLQRIDEEELKLAEHAGKAFESVLRLPAYTYAGENARQLTKSQYIWGRNLLANRIFTCPVLYYEPFVMNNQEVYERLAVGHYEGRARIAGRMHRSILGDYATAVVEGLTSYYSEARRDNP